MPAVLRGLRLRVRIPHRPGFRRCTGGEDRRWRGRGHETDHRQGSLLVEIAGPVTARSREAGPQDRGPIPSPEMLGVEDDQRHMHGPAGPIDVAFSGPVARQADIACAESLDDAVAAAFELELAGEEDRQVVDDLRMPVYEAVLPAHEAEADWRAGDAPLVRRRREQLRIGGKIRPIILALIQMLDVRLVAAPRSEGAGALRLGIRAGPIRRDTQLDEPAIAAGSR